MQLPPLFIRGKLSEVNPILSVVSYNRQRSHRHLQPALHPAELTTGGKWTYNRQCGHDLCNVWWRLWHVFEIKLLINGNAKFVEIVKEMLRGKPVLHPKYRVNQQLLFA